MTDQNAAESDAVDPAATDQNAADPAVIDQNTTDQAATDPDGDGGDSRRSGSAGAVHDRDSLAYDVPPDAPVARCERCGRPFAREDWLALHRGLEHPTDLSEGEIEAFRAAHDEEYEEIRLFRLRALGTLVAVYFALLLIYAVL